MELEIRKESLVEAPIATVWAALTDPKAIGRWMEDEEVQVDLRPGGKVAFFGGVTTGEIRSFNRPTSLSYTWRQAEWPVGWADSIVDWDLAAEASKATRVRLRHWKLPNKSERDSHDEGWDLYWLGPMAEHLEHSDQV